MKKWRVDVVTIPENDIGIMRVVGLQEFCKRLTTTTYVVMGADRRHAKIAAKRAWCKDQKITGLKPRVYTVSSISNSSETVPNK